MFEKFTDRARTVLAVANQEAEHWNREVIDTEHLLLGLIKKSAGGSESTAIAILVRLQVDLCRLRKEVEKRMKRGPAEMKLGKLPQTPVAKRVIAEAIEEAIHCNQNHVGTEHLLLGLLKVEEGVAWEALTACGLTLDQVRQEVVAVLAAATAAYVKEVVELKPTASEDTSAIDRDNQDPLPTGTYHVLSAEMMESKWYLWVRLAEPGAEYIPAKIPVSVLSTSQEPAPNGLLIIIREGSYTKVAATQPTLTEPTTR